MDRISSVVLTLSFLCNIWGLRLRNSWIKPLADIITSEGNSREKAMISNEYFNTEIQRYDIKTGCRSLLSL